MIPLPTKIKVKSVYLNAFGEIFFTCHDTLFTPFNIARLEVVADKILPENTMNLSDYIKELQKVEKRNPNLKVVKIKTNKDGLNQVCQIDCYFGIGIVGVIDGKDKVYEDIPERSEVMFIE